MSRYHVPLSLPQQKQKQSPKSYLCSGLFHTWFPLPYMCTVPHCGGESVPKTLPCHNSAGVWFHSTFLKKKNTTDKRRLGWNMRRDWGAQWSVQSSMLSEWIHFSCVCFIVLSGFERKVKPFFDTRDSAFSVLHWHSWNRRRNLYEREEVEREICVQLWNHLVTVCFITTWYLFLETTHIDTS